MKYNFRTISVFYFIIIFGICLITIGFLGTRIFGIMYSFSAMLFTVFTMITSYFIARKLTLGKVQITLTNKKIDYLWLKKPLLTFQNNESIDIENIKSWKYREEFQYSYFKIYNPADIITIMRFSNWSSEKDDFSNFLFAFKKLIKRVNKKRIINTIDNNENPNINNKIIDKEVDFYKSKGAKLLLYIYFLTIIMASYHLFENWNNKESYSGFMIFGILGCIFLIQKHFRFTKGK